MTLGEIIATARKEKGLTQKQLAALVKKEDGKSISGAYLNDIEHDRRSPTTDHLIEQFANALGIEAEVLYFTVKRIPAYAYNIPADRKRIIAAFRAFQRTLEKGAVAS